MESKKITVHHYHSHPENDAIYKGLIVNEGVESLPAVNPYIKSRQKRQQLTADEFVAGIRNGKVAVLSQAVTLVESSLPEYQQLVQEVVEKCLPFTGNSIRLGIIGVPGAGKSTFIESLGIQYAVDAN